jgi:hypothetical protein
MRVVASLLRRRLLLGLLSPLLTPILRPLPALAADAPAVDVRAMPEVCQGRARDQDFVVIRYVGRLADGRPFDERYATSPLTYELGSFYLPGVDQALADRCVGSQLTLRWSRAPDLGAQFRAQLPPGQPITMDLELLSIKYSLFGEKMRSRAQGPYAARLEPLYFAEAPLTLTSAADGRGHSSTRDVTLTKDNPFSIAAGEKNLIANPSGMIEPLVEGMLNPGSTQLKE